MFCSYVSVTKPVLLDIGNEEKDKRIFLDPFCLRKNSKRKADLGSVGSDISPPICIFFLW